jgi:glycosyltransferase involved in cell wall biosynthesis
MARVSVLIPTHDRLDYLPRTLESVYAQTTKDFDVVVADDGSADGTAAWLRRRKFPRLRLLRTARNRGPAAARNLALSAARGVFVAFLDSDDLWAPDYLRRTLAAFKSAATQAVTSDICTIDSAGEIILRDFYRTNPKVREPRFERLSGLRCCPSLTSTVLRRSVFDTLGGFDEGFKRLHDDKDLLFRLAARFGPKAFRFVPENLAYHRRHDAQMTSYIEKRTGNIASAERLGRWGNIGAHERELVLDLAYFSAKHGADARRRQTS